MSTPFYHFVWFGSVFSFSRCSSIFGIVELLSQDLDMSASPDLLPTTLLARAWNWKSNPFGTKDERGHQDSEHYSYDLRCIIHVSPDVEGLRVRVSELIHKLDKDSQGPGRRAACELREDMARHGMAIEPVPEPPSTLTGKIKKIFRR